MEKRKDMEKAINKKLIKYSLRKNTRVNDVCSIK